MAEVARFTGFLVTPKTFPVSGSNPTAGSGGGRELLTRREGYARQALPKEFAPRTGQH